VSYTSSLITELRGLGDLSYISFFCLLGTARFEIGFPSAILVNILDGCGSTMKNRRGQEVIFPFLHLLIQTPFATYRLIRYHRCQLLPRQVTRWLWTVRDGASGRGGSGLQEALWPSHGQILRLGETVRGSFPMADEWHGRGL